MFGRKCEINKVCYMKCVLRNIYCRTCVYLTMCLLRAVTKNYCTLRMIKW